MPLYVPQGKKRTALLRKLKAIFRSFRSQPVGELIATINPILRGWVKYFAVGHASRCFSYIQDWVEKRSGAIWAEPDSAKALDGNDGAELGCTRRWDSSRSTA